MPCFPLFLLYKAFYWIVLLYYYVFQFWSLLLVYWALWQFVLIVKYPEHGVLVIRGSWKTGFKRTILEMFLLTSDCICLLFVHLFWSYICRQLYFYVNNRGFFLSVSLWTYEWRRSDFVHSEVNGNRNTIFTRSIFLTLPFKCSI